MGLELVETQLDFPTLRIRERQTHLIDRTNRQRCPAARRVTRRAEFGQSIGVLKRLNEARV
jgi:hypothetical protein